MWVGEGGMSGMATSGRVHKRASTEVTELFSKLFSRALPDTRVWNKPRTRVTDVWHAHVCDSCTEHMCTRMIQDSPAYM